MTCGLPVPADRLSLDEAGRVAWLRAHRLPPEVPERLRLPLLRGKLEQTCPDCGVSEAAHFVCSACLLPMGPDDWRLQVASAAKRAALARAHEKRRSARFAQAGAAEAPEAVPVAATAGPAL